MRFAAPSKARSWKCASRLLTSPSFPASSLCASWQVSLVECSCLVFLYRCLCYPCSQGPQRNLEVWQCGQTLRGESCFRQENGVLCHIISQTSLNTWGCPAWATSLPCQGHLWCLVLLGIWPLPAQVGWRAMAKQGLIFLQQSCPWSQAVIQCRWCKADFKTVFMAAEWLSGCRSFCMTRGACPCQRGQCPQWRLQLP